MKLAGYETYSVKRGKRTVQARLSDLLDCEILSIANSGEVSNALSADLYAYQARRRRQQAGVNSIPCWIKDLTDEQAYMELVLCNTQSELHPLEEGKHAAESRMDLKAYAEASGKGRQNLSLKVMAWRVLDTCHTCSTDPG